VNDELFFEQWWRSLHGNKYRARFCTRLSVNVYKYIYVTWIFVCIYGIHIWVFWTMKSQSTARDSVYIYISTSTLHGYSCMHMAYIYEFFEQWIRSLQGNILRARFCTRLCVYVYKYIYVTWIFVCIYGIHIWFFWTMKSQSTARDSVYIYLSTNTLHGYSCMHMAYTYDFSVVAPCGSGLHGNLVPAKFCQSLRVYI